MKIDITLEHHDLINHITAYLAMQGLKPAGDVRFIRKKTGKGEPERYEIKISCDGTDIPTTCPTCNQSRGQKTPAVIPKEPAESVAMPAVVEPEGEEELTIDPDLGESTEPPEYAEPADPGDGEGPSIMTLVRKSESIKQERERADSKRRAPSSARMPGESTRPPEGGQ